MKKSPIIYLLATWLLLCASSIFGQNQIRVTADSFVVNNTVKPPTSTYVYNVQAYHNGSFIYCDNAILKGNDLYAVGNVSILSSDTTEMYGDTLIYLGDSSVAYLVKDVVLVKGPDTLYSTDLKYDMTTKLATYTNKALMVSGVDKLKSEIRSYNSATKEAWFYKNVSIEGDSLYMVTDTLHFFTDTKFAEWFSPSIITSKNSKLYSGKGQYDIGKKLGTFWENAQYEEDTITAVGDTIFYDGNKELVKLLGNASYLSNADTATADSIYYSKQEENIILVGNGVYIGQDTKAQGARITYDKKNDLFKFLGKSVIEDDPVFIKADQLDYNKKSKKGLAIGNVVYRDTVEKIIIWADTLDSDGSINYMRATSEKGKPVLGTEVDGDTLFVSALVISSFQKIIDPNLLVVDSLNISDSTFRDTTYVVDRESIRKNSKIDSLGVPRTKETQITKAVEAKSKSETLDKPSTDITTQTDTLKLRKDSTDAMIVRPDTASIKRDTIDYLSAIGDVVIYKKDMQARCDSLIFNSRDSIFSLIKNPVLWIDSTQMTGDTIDLGLLNGKLNSLMIKNNGLILNSPDAIFYNQIQGKKINGNFEDGSLESMKVNGNAQTLYYMVEDKDTSYLGVNKTECSFLIFQFKEKKISDIRYYINATSKIMPMEGTNHEEIKFKGFRVRFDEKPKSKEELFVRKLVILPVVNDIKLKTDEMPLPKSKF